MRRIYCEQCGIVKPTPPGDVGRGLIPRRTVGTLFHAALCDLCGKELGAGQKVVAITAPRSIGFWEDSYMDIT